jgi:hypothetical protein
VAVGQFEIMFDLPLTDGETSANNGTNGGYVAWERVCLVDSSPTEFQVVPWVDFLEFTCRWAFGSVGQAQTMRELTKGFNKSNRCPFNRTRYSPSVSARYYIGGPLPYIWLTRFIDDITIDPPRTLDCRDYAAILLVEFESQGTSPTFRRLERWDHIFEYVPGGFYTWPLCPAGTDDTISGNRQENLGDYQSEPFAYHCVVGWSGQRYDAAASYLWNPNAQVWENPAFDWIELLHWQNPVGSNYYGLAYGLVAATYPFQYNQSLSWHYRDGVQPVYIN